MATICKLVANDLNNPQRGGAFKDEVVSPGLTLEEMIADDKRYGFLTPHGGELWYVLLNHDREMSLGEATRGINAAIMGWEAATDINFSRVSVTESPDITIQFLSSDEDQLFRDEPNVLAYMYYPISGSNVRGLMVINSDYPWTINGKPMSGAWIEDVTGKQVQDRNAMYQTWAIRKVVRHELGHGVYGLPHSRNTGNTMYYSYGGMSDFTSDEDEARGQAKAGSPSRGIWFINKARRWLRARYYR